MSKTILFFVFSCFTIFFFIGLPTAQAEPTCGYRTQNGSGLKCYRQCETCMASCDEKHSTPKYDVWGKARKESAITRANREKCKSSCTNLVDYCIKRIRKLEENRELQEELESQLEETQDDTSTKYPAPPSATTEYSPALSGNSIYRWTDKNGVVHITNNKSSIPAEYIEQIEENPGGQR